VCPRIEELLPLRGSQHGLEWRKESYDSTEVTRTERLGRGRTGTTMIIVCKTLLKDRLHLAPRALHSLDDGWV